MYEVIKYTLHFLLKRQWRNTEMKELVNLSLLCFNFNLMDTITSSLENHYCKTKKSAHNCFILWTVLRRISPPAVWSSSSLKSWLHSRPPRPLPPCPWLSKHHLSPGHYADWPKVVNYSLDHTFHSKKSNHMKHNNTIVFQQILQPHTFNKCLAHKSFHFKIHFKYAININIFGSMCTKTKKKSFITVWQ